jgi:hypothetical protein
LIQVRSQRKMIQRLMFEPGKNRRNRSHPWPPVGW